MGEKYYIELAINLGLTKVIEIEKNIGFIFFVCMNTKGFNCAAVETYWTIKKTP